MIPLFFLFLIPNLFQFSVEMAANHKFFNFFLLFGAMLSAYVLVRIFSVKYIGKLAGFVALVALIFSGIIDFFPVYNDGYMSLPDIPKNEAATWIRDYTPEDAVFLNSSYFFHPASLAGRKIFQGWPYFSWSAGYNQNRIPFLSEMYETRNPEERCTLLANSHISYVTVENVTYDPNLPTIDLNYFLVHYTPVFLSANKRYAIFTTESMCYK